MRWCCGGGSGTSSANINNNCQESSSSFDKTPTTMITELSYKSGKNLTKLLKVKNGRDGTKCKNNNEKHCLFQQHQNNQNLQLSELESRENTYTSTDGNETARRGVLKSSLKLLRNKSGDHQRAKGVQYADEVKLHSEIINEDRDEDADRNERVRLLQNEESKNVAQLLNTSKKSEEIKLGGANLKYQFINDRSFQIDIDTPIKQSHFHNSSLPILKQNNTSYNHHPQNFDKYGPMLVHTCKTALYICANTYSPIIIEPKLLDFESTLPPSLLPCAPTASTSTANNEFIPPLMIRHLQNAGWTIIIINQENCLNELCSRRPVLVLIDEKVNDFVNLYNLQRSLPECDDILISAFLEHLPTEEQIIQNNFFQQFFLYSNTDIKVCELFARLASRLRAVPALFAVIEEAEEPIKICDENNIAQYVNRAYEIVTGKLRTDVLGSNASDMREKTLNNVAAAAVVTSTATMPTTAALSCWQNFTPPTSSTSTVVVEQTSGSSTVPTASVLKEISTNPILSTSTLEIAQDNIENSNASSLSFTSAMPGIIPTSSLIGSNIRRRSSEWHCITVPSCSTMSSQFVYVKRGSADAIGRDLSLKSLRSNSALVEAPITEALNVLGSVLAKCNDEETHMQVQNAIKILSSTELYAPTITRFRDNDRIASGYYDGLIRLHHPSRQRKRSVVDAFRENQQRRVSCGSSASGISSNDGYVNPTRRRISTDINALENENSWQFDVIELERITEHRPLSQLGIKIFERWNVAETLHCSIDNLARWLQVIEANYQSGNAYHNATHAADVLQATSFFLNSDAVGQFVQDHHAVAALLAATVHDLDHPGRGNAFLMNTRARLAVLYNDQSILENHHVALAFQLTLTQPGVNIFSRLSSDEFVQLRQATIDMVLATDMSRHFEYLTKFQQILGILPDTEENRDANSLTICRMMVKCSDIANPTREWKLCYQWAMRIVVEYFEQTAEELEKRLPLTMKGFDRETCNIPLTQCTFVDMFAREAFTSWCEFAELPNLLIQLELNYEKWKTQATDWDPKQNITVIQNRQGVVGR